MKKLVSLSTFSLLLSTGAAYAAPAQPQCKKPDAAPDPMMASADQIPKLETNCFVDDVFVLDGNEQLDGKPLVACFGKDPTKPVDPAMNPITGKDCILGADTGAPPGAGVEAVGRRVMQILKEKNVAIPQDGWDELVIFTTDIARAKDQDGPLFFRLKNAAGKDINQVDKIGLEFSEETKAKNPDLPFVGIISAGSTNVIKGGPDGGTYGPCGSAPRNLKYDSPSAQNSPALCAPGAYNFFDALAQATAALYGPYLKADPMTTGKDFIGMGNGDLSVLPTIKGKLVKMDMGTPKPIFDGNMPTVWNAFLDTRGSLLGGNTWRNNGNGTFEATKAPPFLEVVGTDNKVNQTLRFVPLDLYVMGLASAAEVQQAYAQAPLQSYMHALPSSLYYPSGLAAFSGNVGPNMGIRYGGVSLRTPPKTLPFDRIVQDNGGERVPAADAAPHFIKQLWVMVTRPTFANDAAAMQAGEGKDIAERVNLYKIEAQAWDWIQSYRRKWQQYFYKLTSWRGRVVTTVSGAEDDLAYWEFGSAADDRKNFTAVGAATITINGVEPVPNSINKMTALRVNVMDDSGGVRFEGKTIPVNIDGNDYEGKVKYPNNVLTVRMRLPNDPGLREKLIADYKKGKGNQLFARFVFDNGPEVTLPGLPEVGFLIPDGKWRNYSVNLAETDFKGGSFKGFTFFPSTMAMDGIEIEFIRIANSGAPKDEDRECPSEKDRIAGIAGKLKPDGFVDSEDNCPTVFNPFQEDGNEDGKGDACEDYDGDNVINACDNCPVLTNSRQKDSDNDKLGDVCDPDHQPNDCVFRPDTVAGPVAPVSALWGLAALMVGGVGMGLRWRRRKR